MNKVTLIEKTCRVCGKLIEAPVVNKKACLQCRSSAKYCSQNNSAAYSTYSARRQALYRKRHPEKIKAYLLRYNKIIKPQWQLAKRKARIKEKGGVCKVCGYSKYVTALHLHHNEPVRYISTHRGALRSDWVSNQYWDPKKYTLLCANCHEALHHGELSLPE